MADYVCAKKWLKASSVILETFDFSSSSSACIRALLKDQKRMHARERVVANANIQYL